MLTVYWYTHFKYIFSPIRHGPYADWCTSILAIRDKNRKERFFISYGGKMYIKCSVRIFVVFQMTLEWVTRRPALCGNVLLLDALSHCPLKFFGDGKMCRF